MALASAAHAIDAVSSADQSLFTEIRKGIKSLQVKAVEMENLHRTDEVKKLENALVQLLNAGDYTSSNNQNHPLVQRFREAVWNVHHAGQPMPGEEHEDIVMTNTQVGLLNTVCPLSGKSVTELLEPIRSMDCKHVYEKEAIVYHTKNNTISRKCPVAGCPKQLLANRVACDPLLLVEIEEMRSLSKQTDMADLLEDFTDLDQED